MRPDQGNKRELTRIKGRVSNHSKPKNHFIGIGIESFKNNNASHKPLPNAPKDVKDISEILGDEYNYNSDDGIKLFLNEQATEGNLKEYLTRFHNLSEDRKQDSLLIYFAGHGDVFNKETEDENAGWCMYDFKNDDGDGFFAERSILNEVEAIALNNILIIDDKCFPGDKRLIRSSRVREELDSASREKIAHWLSSVRVGCPAVEGKKGQYSPFSKSIIKILKNNTNKELSLNDEILKKYYKYQDYTFINLIRASPTRSFKLYKRSKHPMLKFEDEIWNRMGEMEMQPRKIHQLFKELFPNSDRCSELDYKLRRYESEIDKDWKKLLTDLTLSLFEFTTRHNRNQGEIIRESEKMALYLIKKYRIELYSISANTKKSEHWDYLQSIKKRAESLKRVKEYDYECREVEIKISLDRTSNPKKLSVGTKGISVDWYHDFSIEEKLEDYKLRQKDQFYGYDNIDLLPATNVNWLDAILFANWLSMKNGFMPYYKIIDNNLVGEYEGSNGYRLPTIEEWEGIASSGLDLSNESFLDQTANYKRNNTPFVKKPGSMKPDINGIYDLFGNTHEWCWDAKREEDEILFYCKGGAYTSSKDQLNVDENVLRSSASHDIGFRLVRNLDYTIDNGHI